MSQISKLRGAVEERMLKETLQEKSEDLDLQIVEIREKAINAYKKYGEQDPVSRTLTASYQMAIKIKKFTDILLSYSELITLVFSTTKTVEHFFESFNSMMNFSLQRKSTIFTRWKQRRQIKQFKKQLKYKFDELAMKMDSINDFTSIIGEVMDSLNVGEKPKKKKKKKGEPQDTTVPPEVLELRAAAGITTTTETTGDTTGGSSSAGGVDSSGLL